jgi:hypothetical protein
VNDALERAWEEIVVAHYLRYSPSIFQEEFEKTVKNLRMSSF